MNRFFFPALTALLLLGALAPHTLRAAPQNVTFNVNSTLDEADANPGDGKCKATPSKKCTLRAAVMETNALGGSNTIVLPAGTLFFNLSGVNEDNAATGDLDIKSNLTLVGAGASSTYLNALALDRAFHIISGKTVIKNMTIRNGLALNSGGGIYVNSGASLKLVKSVVKESVANYNGGGIAGYGAITVNRSTIGPLNRDAFGGGGIASSFKLTLVKSTVTQNGTGSSGGIGQGGGIFSNGATVIRESVIDHNIGKLGGGIYVQGGTLELFNSTVADNSALQEGGGLYNNGTTQLRYTTLAKNDAPFGATAGGIFNNGGSVNLYHSLLDLNRVDVVNDDCQGSITTTSYNLIFGTNGCTLNANAKNILGISSLVNDLANNGGPTQTMSLQMGSDAMDVIPANKCLDANSNPLTRDQRGKPRPADGDADNKKKCDLGAYEAQP
jgi:CSLREA domain-containing protein